MKSINRIISKRANKRIGHSWDIVFEWEDIISKNMNILVSPETDKRRRVRKVLNLLRIEFLYDRIFNNGKYSLQFVTDVELKSSPANKYIIPIIIDFWYEGNEIEQFINYYRHVPLVFFTNMEVVSELIKWKTPFAVAHYPLSLPDQYAFQKQYVENKEYDFCFLGRQNPYFLRYIERYCEENPEFEYIYSKGTNNNREYYSNKRGQVGNDTGRESYIEMLRKTKITCYTTPGYDESKTRTSRYNQVTPRVLEMLANGCQVIGHYPSTEDTSWYKLSSVIPNVDTYEQFRDNMNRMRTQRMNIEEIQSFLKHHYTSSSIKLLEEVLVDNGFKIN